MLVGRGREFVLEPAEDPRTYIAVCTGNGVHGNAEAVTAIPGLWHPPIGTIVQLAEPNRDARVCSVRSAFSPDGELHNVVYLDDPETTAPDTR